MNTDNKPKTLAGRISECFINGLIITVPPAITAFVVISILNFTEGTLGALLPINFPGVGLITIVAVIWIVGFVGGYKISKRIILFFEYLLDKIPVVKFIYSSVKQFSKAVLESNSAFQKVVLVPYHQSLALGFLMPNIPKAITEKIGKDYVCVFVPWSLNMTSGTNLFVKKTDVIYVKMTSEEALQFMLTAGTISKK